MVSFEGSEGDCNLFIYDCFLAEDMEKIHSITAPGIFMISAMVLLLVAKYRSMF